MIRRLICCILLVSLLASALPVLAAGMEAPDHAAADTVSQDGNNPEKAAAYSGETVEDSAGVVYSADMRTLVKFPYTCSAITYTVPDTVTEIAENALEEGYFRNLQEIIFPDSVQRVRSQQLKASNGEEIAYVRIVCSDDSELARYCDLYSYPHYPPQSQTMEQIMRNIVKNCRGKDDYATALNIHDWLASNVQLTSPFPYPDPTVLFTTGSSDTISLAVEYAALLRIAGLEAETVVHDLQNYWVKAKLGQSWYHIDVTTDILCGCHWFFGLTDRAIYGYEAQDSYPCTFVLRIDHRGWTCASSASCTAWENSYLIRSGEYGAELAAGKEEIRSRLAGGETEFTVQTEYNQIFGEMFAAWLSGQTYTVNSTDVQVSVLFDQDTGAFMVLPAFDASVLEDYVFSYADGGLIINSYIGSDTAVSIPGKAGSYNVRKIDACAFLNNVQTESVSVPDTVTEIGEEAFSRCCNLKTVRLSKAITAIPELCFFGSEQLQSVSGGSIRTLGKNAFGYCQHLKKLNFDLSNLVSVSDYAFDQCHCLTTVPIGSRTQYIGESAFASCDSITSVSIPDGIEVIKYYAFGSCVSLTSVTLPDTLKTIEEYAFYLAPIERVVIPDGTVSIGAHALDSAEYISLSATVASIGEGALNPDAELVVDKANPYFCMEKNALYDKNKTILLWYSRKATETVFTMPDGVKTIGDNAFTGNSHLKKIILPEGLINLGIASMGECAQLESVIIPDSVTEFPRGVLGQNPNLIVTFPANLKTIGPWALEGVGNETIWLPDSVTTVEWGAFMLCHNLKRLKLSESMTKLVNCMYGDTSLKELYIPASIRSIDPEYFDKFASQALKIYGIAGSYAETFARNYGFTFVATVNKADPFNDKVNALWLPDSLTKIGDQAFYGITSETVHLPTKCTRIGKEAFAYSAVTKVYVSPALTYIADDAFLGCGKIVFYCSMATSYIESWATEHGVTLVTAEDE